MNELIILGNGFDLHCDLKSSFNDFFVAKELDNAKQWIDNYTSEAFKKTNLISLFLFNTFYRENITLYNFYFEPRTIKFGEVFQSFIVFKTQIINWMDVELFILSFLKAKRLKFLIDCFERTFKKKLDQNDLFLCEKDGIPQYFNLCATEAKYTKVNSFYSLFMAELNDFEERFSNYLSESVDKTPAYISKAKYILKKICQNNSGTIMNFNYTHVPNNTHFNEINVHGSLGKDVIIGIDLKEAASNEQVQFTKTFRKLISKENQIVLNADYDEIIIYGHSLNKQDYSYFQSIFDYLNLYESHTKVKFIYSDDFIEEDDEYSNNKFKYKMKIAKSLYTLIGDYGGTLSNKDNGKNLIHKLILEGRLNLEHNNFDGYKTKK